MVRLKAELAGKGINSVKFQFHYGTIKRNKQLTPTSVRVVFQFHYGTIKRGRLR